MFVIANTTDDDDDDYEYGWSIIHGLWNIQLKSINMICPDRMNAQNGMQKEKKKKHEIHFTPGNIIRNADRCAFSSIDFFLSLYLSHHNFVCRLMSYAFCSCARMCWFYFGLMLANWQCIKCHWTVFGSSSLAHLLLKLYVFTKWNAELYFD